MKKYILHLILVFTFFSGRLAAQLSPGDLANAHKGLEGMSNCTQCHDIGSKVSNDKCLNCHKEIKYRTDRNSGFHASQEVRGKDCASCHSDHHGRNFNMVRFDEKNFKHNVTGYDLTGKHGRIECRDCHKPEYIGDAGLKKRQNTFLGLQQACNSCHKDTHQKTLGNDCTKCHNTEAFKPASRFNHDKTDFALLGKHKTVQCIDCHIKETKNGEPFQRFDGVPFKNCNSCHDDPHNNNLGSNCKECHSEQSFDAPASLHRFNHSKTLFALKGKHKQVDCRECHKMEVPPLNVLQDRSGVLPNDCKTCHKDVHDGKFGTNCAECHNEDSFRKVGDLGKFNHNQTSFVLKGKHETVDCKKCHTTKSMTDPLPHNTCATCHKDYHEGQFVNPVKTPDCSACHTEDGFAGSSYTVEQHAVARFPLDGAHIATPCLACHQKDNKWKFRNIGERCVDCHKDVHEGQIDSKWYVNQACNNCHSTSSWQDNHFDHEKTAFKLLGAHKKQSCDACHVPDADFKHGRFAGLPATCNSCHDDEHNRQFEKNGVTDCAKCHGNDSWPIPKYDHNKTRFKLDGKHAKVSCAGCHKPVMSGGVTFIQYKFKSFECVVCHK